MAAPSLRRWWPAVVLVTLLAMVATYAAVGRAVRSDRDARLTEVPVGDVVLTEPGAHPTSVGVRTVVVTPGVVLEVTAGLPSATYGAHRAADGGLLVPVQWQTVREPAPGATGDEVLDPVTVAVRRGGETLALPDGVVVTAPAAGSGRDEPLAGAVLLAAAGGDDPGLVGPRPREVEDLELAVTFDGVTQTVDLLDGSLVSGVAAGLYDAAPFWVTSDACDLVAAAPVELEPVGYCTSSAVRTTAWAPGVGWVEDPEQRWATVDVQVVVAEAGVATGDPVGGDNPYYASVSFERSAVTLDGAAAVAGEIDASGDDFATTVLPVEASAARFTLALRGEVVVSDPDGELPAVVVPVDQEMEYLRG